MTASFMNAPLLIKTVEPLKLPNFCLHCGRETRHKIRVPVYTREGEEDRAILKSVGRFVHLAHIALLFFYFLSKTVKIPLCPRCHVNLVFPARFWMPVFGMTAFLFSTYYFMAHDNMQYGLISIFFCVIMMFVISILDQPHRQQAALPIKVCCDKGLYYYYVWDGPLYDSEKLIRATPPPIPPDLGPGN